MEYRGHLQTTACCVFLPTPPGGPARVATSSHDSSLKIWDQNTAGNSWTHSCMYTDTDWVVSLLALTPPALCSVCLATLSLDGAGPLVALAPSDSNSLLCASFNSGLHHIHVDQGSNQVQGSGAGSGGAGGLDIKVVARF